MKGLLQLLSVRGEHACTAVTVNARLYDREVQKPPSCIMMALWPKGQRQSALDPEILIGHRTHCISAQVKLLSFFMWAVTYHCKVGRLSLQFPGCLHSMVCIGVLLAALLSNRHTTQRVIKLWPPLPFHTIVPSQGS